jgi:hypothetical protein
VPTLAIMWWAAVGALPPLVAMPLHVLIPFPYEWFPVPPGLSPVAGYCVGNIVHR